LLFCADVSEELVVELADWSAGTAAEDCAEVALAAFWSAVLLVVLLVVL